MKGKKNHNLQGKKDSEFFPSFVAILGADEASSDENVVSMIKILKLKITSKHLCMNFFLLKKPNFDISGTKLDFTRTALEGGGTKIQTKIPPMTAKEFDELFKTIVKQISTTTHVPSNNIEIGHSTLGKNE